MGWEGLGTGEKKEGAGTGCNRAKQVVEAAIVNLGHYYSQYREKSKRTRRVWLRTNRLVNLPATKISVSTAQGWGWAASGRGTL